MKMVLWRIAATIIRALCLAVGLVAVAFAFVGVVLVTILDKIMEDLKP